MTPQFRRLLTTARGSVGSSVMRRTSALAERDTLNVRGAREHIHWLNPGKAIGSWVAEKAQIARERCRIAGDVDERAWRKLLNGAQDAGIAASARWIYQGDVNTLASTHELVNHALDLAFENGDILGAVRRCVGVGVSYGARRRFDGPDVLSALGEKERE